MSGKRFFKHVSKMLRIILVKFKPLTVHTEAVFYDEVWKEIKKKILEKKVLKWYVMTPENYDYLKGYFNFSLSKKHLSEIMKKRYLEMIKQGEKLELHIHLHPIMKISVREQEELIKKSVQWFKSALGYPPREIVFGWWRWNENSEEIAEKYHLKIIKFDDYNSIHDYDWVIKCKGESYL